MFRRVIVPAIVAIASVGLLTGCATVSDAPEVVSSGSAVKVVDSKFSSDDMAFLTVLTPRVEQALEIAALADAQSDNADVKAIAANVLDVQGADFKKLSAWLAEAKRDGVKPTDLRQGSNVNRMGSASPNPTASPSASVSSLTGEGLISAADMEKLRNASGFEFNKLFLEYMINHEEYAIASTFYAAASGNNDVKLFAEHVVASQSPELEKMQDMFAGF